ncbi:MAG TPA: alpha/beta fold hydrolase [Planctomycetota bacterium]|nr:alpha/beta fold hydrolase [Planctomycetota bacterium]
MRLVRLLVTGLSVGTAVAQSCVRPEPPPGGFATQFDLLVPVVYSDGYETFGSMLLPAAPAPACGWPLVVFVHPLGQSRGFDLGFQTLVQSQGYAVWSYDVRGHGQAVAANPAHPNAGSTLWGPVERLDLAEQIDFVAGNQTWTGVVDASRVAVVGSSQGGAHAWAAAALSGHTVQAPGRPSRVFPTVACAFASEFVGDSVDDWLRGGLLFSSWFLEAISGSYPALPMDAAFVQMCRSAFLAQDPGSLVVSFAAEGRGIGDLLATSSVPMMWAHAYHDVVDNPLPGMQRLQTLAGRHRALLGTVGHGSPDNVAERAFRESLALRWLDRFLWNTPNEVDDERPIVLAELPLDAAERDDLASHWNHAHTIDPLHPSSSPRWYLHDDFVLRETEPAAPQATASIHQVIDPLATDFTPLDYLDQPAVRDIANVLTVCPLQELVYALTTTTEQQLESSARVHLRVVPDQAQWMLAALLTVQPPGSGAQEVMLGGNAIASVTSTPGTAEDREFLLPPVAARLPAGSIVRLRLRNLWLRESPMPRVLEVAPRFHDFQVNVVHGDAAAGSWLDLPLEPVQPRLVVSQPFLPLQAAPSLQLTLRGGTVRAGYPYFMAVGLSGHEPSIPYLNDIVPVEGDWLVIVSAGSSQAPFFGGFLGFLDGEGVGTATLDLSSAAPLPGVLNGLQLTFVGFAWDGAWAPTGKAANPCDVMLR